MGLERINLMRKQTNMSIDELSAKSGVPKGTLSKITAGITKNPSIETVKAIVYCMGFTLDDLVDDNFFEKKAPSLADAKSDAKLHYLYENYAALNQEGRDKLIDYSEDLVSSGRYITHVTNLAAARGGQRARIEHVENPDDLLPSDDLDNV